MQKLRHDWTFCTNVQNNKIWQLDRKRKKHQSCQNERSDFDRDVSQSETDCENDEDNMVLHVNGSGFHLFVMKGMINKDSIIGMIDSGSPINIFTQADDLLKTLEVDVIFARPLSRNENYVHYINKPLNLVGFIQADVQVGQKKIKNPQIVATRDGKDR